MRTLSFALLLGLSMTGLSPLSPALAGEAEDKGRAIAEEWDRRDRGFGDTVSVMKMVLENAHGQTSERRMRFKTLENPDPKDGDRSLLIFDKPRDIKGTALLTFSHILEPDDQWLYLPAVKRIKRISSKNKSGPFVGSEFAYEDFSAQELEKYSYKFLREEPCAADGKDVCFVLEQKPLYENSGYTRLIAWYDKDEYRQRRIEYYDRKGSLLKTLTFSDYRKYLGQYWRPHDMYMVNAQNGKKTRLIFEKITFRNGLSERDFNRNTLKRAR